MAKKKQEGLSRRDFISGRGRRSRSRVGSAPFFLFPETRAAEQKTLKILQVEPLRSAYDTGSMDVCKQWGQKHDTNVTVDHINLVPFRESCLRGHHKEGSRPVHASLAATAYEKQTIDMSHVYQEVRKKTQEDRSRAQIHLQSKDQRYFAFLRFLLPIPELA